MGKMPLLPPLLLTGNRGGENRGGGASMPAGQGQRSARGRGMRERGARESYPLSHLGLRWSEEARPWERRWQRAAAERCAAAALRAWGRGCVQVPSSEAG
jgi:hypothetical protein